MRKLIGLVIWGCKGGYRAFCSNNVVNTGEEVISQTIKDIRSFIRIHRTGHDFYAIEFTSKYKVFTNYRSSNDSGTGAFIAFTIYVPHNVKILNMRAMFKEMMDGYFRDYMNPLSNTPLAGKYDDINKFIPILERYEVKADKPCYRLPSNQDDKPQLVIYDDISVVDKYFDSPYRPEFFRCQEVMFLGRELYDNATNYQVEFVVKPTIIEHISEPEAESVLVNNLVGFKLTSLVINDEDMLHTNGNCPLSEADTIAFTIEKNEFYDPFSTASLFPNTILTVNDAVTRGLLKRRNRKDFEFVMPTQWRAKRYFFPLFNTGIETEKLCGRVFLLDKNKRIELKRQDQLVQDGRCFFELLGEEINGVYSLGLIPVNASLIEPQYIILHQNIKPIELFQSGLCTDITEKVVNKTSSFPSSYRLLVALENFRVKYTLSTNKLSLFLPASKLSLLRLDFEADDYDAHFDGGSVSFNPSYMYLYVDRGIMDDKIYMGIRLQFNIAGYKYDSQYDKNNRMHVFKLSFDHWLDLKKDNHAGHLYWGGDELPYTLNKDIDKLFMRIVVVTSMCKFPIHVTIQKGARSEIIQMNYHNSLIQAQNTNLATDENVARILDVRSNDTMDLKNIVPVETAHIGDEEKDMGKVGDVKIPKRTITYINCQDFQIMRPNNGMWPIRGQVVKIETKDDTVALYKKDSLVCLIKSGINENCAQVKGKNNFKVYWKDGYTCDVEYKKESIWEIFARSKKWIFGIGAFVLLVGIIIALYPSVSKMFTHDYEYTISIRSGGKINEIKCEKDLEQYFQSDVSDSAKAKMTFKVPSDEIESFLKSFKTQQNFTIESTSDGDTLLSLRQILQNDYGDFEKFFDTNNKDRQKEVQATIQLPSEIEYDRLKNNAAARLSDYAIAAKTYPGKGKQFSWLAYMRVIGSNSKDSLQEYKTLSESFQEFKYNDYYNRVSQKLDSIIKNEKSEEERIRQENEKKNQIAKLNEQLDNINITIQGVEDVLKKAQELQDNKLIGRCNAYKAFFKATKIDDVKHNMKAFSPEQQRVCSQTYAFNTKQFQETKKRVGMSFKKAQDILKTVQ